LYDERYGEEEKEAAAGNKNLLDKDEQIDKDQRELDYEDYRFLNDESVDTLLDVLRKIFKPEYTNKNIFESAESLQDCIQIAQMFYFE
jgi:hypothetical protein